VELNQTLCLMSPFKRKWPKAFTKVHINKTQTKNKFQNMTVKFHQWLTSKDTYLRIQRIKHSCQNILIQTHFSHQHNRQLWYQDHSLGELVCQLVARSQIHLTFQELLCGTVKFQNQVFKVILMPWYHLNQILYVLGIVAQRVQTMNMWVNNLFLGTQEIYFVFVNNNHQLQDVETYPILGIVR